MTDATKTAAAPAPMEGRGAYNRGSRVQAAGISAAIPLFGEAARQTSLPPEPQAIVIADYGASEGRNSLRPMAEAIGALRTRVPAERPVLVMHTDLPDSDFAVLFATLASDPESYLRHDKACFAAAIGRSFYDQVLPSECVTLGWSSWAVHWLSRIPCPIEDQIQIAYSQNERARAAFLDQAAEDWRAFLTHRGAELRPGGQLVVLTMATTDEGDFGYERVVEAMVAALTDLVAAGEVTREEVSRMVVPTVGRRRQDFAAPFADGCFAGLRLGSLDIFLGEDRIYADYERTGDAQSFGADWASFVRASVGPTMDLALESGGEQRRRAFLDQFESHLAARLAMSPGLTAIPLAKMLIAKDG